MKFQKSYQQFFHKSKTSELLHMLIQKVSIRLHGNGKKEKFGSLLDAATVTMSEIQVLCGE